MINSQGDVFLPSPGDDLAYVSRPANEWKVLIVDDDASVHQTIVQALAETPVLGRRIHFLHAYSAQQTIECLLHEPEVVALMLDVLSEQKDAGLNLIRTLRDDLGLHDLRIILRTGQSGPSPEIEAIRDCDINDYHTQSDLSRSSLYATLTSAIRSYEQLQALNTGRRGLDMIIKASERLMTHPTLLEFSRGMISEIAGLLSREIDGFICTRKRDQSTGVVQIIASTPRYTPFVGWPLEAMGCSTLNEWITRALDERRNLFSADFSVLFFPGKSRNDLIAFIETETALDEISRQLLAVFCTNIAINLDNMALFDQLHDQAYSDQLLQIPNRLDFMRTVGTALATHRLTTTIAIVDIDHFSHLNDALGHPYGDSLLKAIANRMIDSLASGTVIARLGADTFGILGPHGQVTPEILLALFHQPFVIEGSEQRLSATIGLARLTEIDGDGSDALKAATIALNLAKNNSRGEGLFFTRSMEFESRARLRLLRELRAAFERERLFVVYQPQFCLKTRRLTGVEALLRWRTDEGNFVPPDQFIPLAESSGLIVGLGRWVLRTACHDLQSLVAEGFSDLRMAVNVSVMQFRHPGFIETVDEALAESRIDPRLLELEITESVAMLDSNFMLNTLDQLKSRGIAIAIDDFGTGFSSLSYLERLKVDRLKIDQSFIHQMTQTHSSLRIVETVIQLGQSLQLQVIAEGVEQTTQADLLENIGCHEAQGYLFAHPMTYTQLRSFLASPPGEHNRSARPTDHLAPSPA
jgi:diguanylate cyclase (GGDEF)-like protein